LGIKYQGRVATTDDVAFINQLILLCQIKKAEGLAPCIELQHFVMLRTCQPFFKACSREEVILSVCDEREPGFTKIVEKATPFRDG
jgi:hypothetical protein